MKPFDPDFSLRLYFRHRYADLLNDRAPRLDPFLPFDVLDDVLFTETAFSIIVTQPPNEQVIDPLSIIFTDSGAANSTNIISPSSSDTFESTQSSSHTISTDFATIKPPKNKRKRPRNSNDVSSEDRCRAIRISRLAKLTFSLDKGKESRALPWAKSILVRVKPQKNEIVEDLRYTFIKLPSPDVHCCTAAICTKMGIPFTEGMPVSWFNSETLLRGPLDHDFLLNMADMQDFVIDLVEIGVRGDVGLLMEMRYESFASPKTILSHCDPRL